MRASTMDSSHTKQSRCPPSGISARPTDRARSSYSGADRQLGVRRSTIRRQAMIIEMEVCAAFCGTRSEFRAESRNSNSEND
jgi:hypothetical protein